MTFVELGHSWIWAAAGWQEHVWTQPSCQSLFQQSNLLSSKWCSYVLKRDLSSLQPFSKIAQWLLKNSLRQSDRPLCLISVGVELQKSFQAFSWLWECALSYKMLQGLSKWSPSQDLHFLAESKPWTSITVLQQRNYQKYWAIESKNSFEQLKLWFPFFWCLCCLINISTIWQTGTDSHCHTRLLLPAALFLFKINE